ncbi:flagellar motor switch protein FliN [Methylocaldum szegediense]|jgi:flagellar motor switch protein FliN/FliY|uniref:Flagellar motor switch protein FliN n=2 Tax=Methylocaldum szegediense TaxID=73780 RepID=A0ABM9I6W2_9GAMM|nr:flagellar motor switch protein FliN [Methylocaldum szegediense]CAI8931153.1 flagellar motor switch protein FliN [Methylocaldum szegediense]
MSDEQEEPTERVGGTGKPKGFADDWAAALSEQREAAKKMAQPPRQSAPSAAEPATFEELGKSQPAAGTARSEDINLDVLLDVPVTIAMEIGRAKINIRNLLQLTQGSVVELDRLAGEPMDVLVNGTLIAHGEVVVVNDKFGIRLTDVISPSERVRKLK